MKIRVCDECCKPIKDSEPEYYLGKGYVVIDGIRGGNTSDLCPNHYDQINKTPTADCIHVKWICQESTTPIVFNESKALKVITGIIQEVTSEHQTLITPDTNLYKNSNCNDLDVVEIIMGLEDYYQTAIDDEDAESFQTVQDILNYLKKIGKSK